MLSVTGMNRFYYLRGFTDMRCKHSRVLSVIREQLHREPSDGDIYIVMSKDRRIVRHSVYGTMFHITFFTNGTSGSVPSDPKAGGPMLSVTGMNRFYYLRGFTDMRCKHSRVLSVIREQLHREPSDGDIYIVMSKDRRIVRLFAYCLLYTSPSPRDA